MSIPTVTRPQLLEPIDPGVWPEKATVVIVGGGPVGLSSALMLAQQGIDIVLLERRGFDARFPRAHLLNVRTMEAFDAMGVADDIYAQGPQDDRWRKVAWFTSVGGPTPQDGVRLGDVPAWGGGADAVRYAAASPRAFANLPQLRLDPLLYAHAAAACPGRIRADQEVIGIENTGDGVVVTARDRVSGEERSIRASYAIVADGGRASEELLGIELEGPKKIRDMVNYHVRTDLSHWAEPDALLGFFFHPTGGARRMGTIQALGPNSYDRNSEEWLVAVSGWVFRDEDTSALGAIRRMLGLTDEHPIELLSESRWVYNGIVAKDWRYGNVFIAGDAAHRHPPTGGLGLNSGVQDAENLAWKLAAVIRGEASDGLLDSYEWERRPTTAFYTAHSLENATRHAPIAEAVGIGPDEEASRRNIDVFLSDTPEGERLRAAVAAAVNDNSHDYSQLNVEAGFRYDAGAFVPDGSPLPTNADSPVEFRATTRPGHHLPHVWVTGFDAVQGARVSTRHLVAQRALTLITGPAGADAWRRACDALTDGLPVELVVIPTENTSWAEVREISEAGAILVRPDAKVAWRVMQLPDDPTDALRIAVDTISRGGNVPSHDPAEPFFERIHAAAATLVE